VFYNNCVFLFFLCSQFFVFFGLSGTSNLLGYSLQVELLAHQKSATKSNSTTEIFGNLALYKINTFLVHRYYMYKISLRAAPDTLVLSAAIALT